MKKSVILSCLVLMFLELGGNGGGHFNVAETDLEGDFEEVKRSLIEGVENQLKQGK